MQKKKKKNCKTKRSEKITVVLNVQNAFILLVIVSSHENSDNFSCIDGNNHIPYWFICDECSEEINNNANSNSKNNKIKSS